MLLALLEHELINTGELAALCRQNGIRSLALFGSCLHGDSRPGSDIDLLVEFEPERRVTLLDMARIKIDLTDVLGRPVDLRTADELSRYFRQEVTAEAVIVYAQA
jgi:predicted nucleotidyltransferase